MVFIAGSIQSGALVKIGDLTSNHQSVRVLGKLVSYGVNWTLEFQGSSVPIDTTLLDQSLKLNLNQLYEVLGEFEDGIIVARIVRNMEGLDTTLYFKGMQVHHEMICNSTTATCILK